MSHCSSAGITGALWIVLPGNSQYNHSVTLGHHHPSIRDSGVTASEYLSMFNNDGAKRFLPDSINPFPPVWNIQDPWTVPSKKIQHNEYMNVGCFPSLLRGSGVITGEFLVQFLMYKMLK